MSYFTYLNRLDELNEVTKKKDYIDINIGDRLEVQIKKKNNSEQTSLFKGVVIRKRNEKKTNFSFTMIKEVNKVVITSVFFYHLSPIINIKKVGEPIKHCRSKLYYMVRRLVKKKVGE